MSTTPEPVGSRTPRDVSGNDDDENNASPPAPPPRRALELVKEEVRRALQAFSTRPLKGFADPPLPSDLLRPFDVCKDARVAYPEFQAGLRGLGIGLTASETESLAREVDTDDTGLVDRKKFERAAIEEWGGDPGVVTEFPSSTSRAQRDRPVKGRLSKSGTPRKTDRRAVRRSGHDVLKRNECHNRFKSVMGDKTAHSDGPRCVISSSADPPIALEEYSSSICGSGNFHSTVNDHGDRGGKGIFPGQVALVSGDPGVKRDQPLPPAPFETRGDDVTSRSKARRGISRSPTMSFNQWRQMTNRGAVVDGVETSLTEDACCRAMRSRGADDRIKSASGSGQSSQKGFQSLSTLRSLLLWQCFGDKAKHHRLRQQAADDYRDRRHHPRQLRHHQQRGETSRIIGNIRKGRRDYADRGRMTFRQKSVRSLSAPVDSGNLRVRGARGFSGKYSYNEDASSPTLELDRSRADAARAEKTLRLRSRGDLIGLRKAFSTADPSGSGIISSLEMERSILRRFGAGLGSREARALAAKYRRDFGGRSMVDYDHLLDDLEAVGESAELVGRAAMRWELPRRRKAKCPPAATIAGHRIFKRVHHDVADGVVVGDCPPAEESQLVRRSRAKTLALLNRHGTEKIDRIFGQLDPARTGSVNFEQLRDGLRLLAGRDPLSDNEYRVLFSDICPCQGRIDYRDLIQTLSAAKARESWEYTQRKLAHQAELPISSRGSGIHLRHSNVLDYAAANDMVSTTPGLSGGRQHKEWRHRALVLQRLRDSVRKVQDDRDSTEPIYDIFRHGQDRIRPVDTAGRGQSAAPNSLFLSSSALRRGLSSLGVPLGNEDFLTLMASVDPMRRGEVSYADFCQKMDLHQLHGNDRFAAATTPRPISEPSSLSSQSMGQGMANGSKNSSVDAGGRERPRETERGGSARRRAMMLAPPDIMNLDGGIFHRNPATDGCTVPTFTTTMMTNAPLDNANYRPWRRQSPTAARSSLHLFSSGGGRIKNDAVGIVGPRLSQRWSETAEEAESEFRRHLGNMRRRSRSFSSVSSCAGAHEPCGGMWDIMSGTASSPCRTSGAYKGDSINRGNRRGRAYMPKNNDLGFGSERIRSQTRRDHRRTENLDSGRRNRSSLGLGAERRYGNRARSSVQHLLRDDSWIGYEVLPDLATASGSSVSRYFHHCDGTDGIVDRYTAQTEPVRLSSSREVHRMLPVKGYRDLSAASPLSTHSSMGQPYSFGRQTR